MTLSGFPSQRQRLRVQEGALERIARANVLLGQGVAVAEVKLRPEELVALASRHWWDRLLLRFHLVRVRVALDWGREPAEYLVAGLEAAEEAIAGPPEGEEGGAA